MDDVATPARRESIPLTLWVIALVALSPFLVTALLYSYGPEGRMAAALSALLQWSAVVLSFLGGVRWGLETRETSPRAIKLSNEYLIRCPSRDFIAHPLY